MPRLTVQKKILQEELLNFRSFFDAQQLLSTASKLHSKIGLATVYRFLANLEKNSHLHSFYCEGKKIYSINSTNHCHFTCEFCKSKEHISIDRLDFLKKKLGKQICHVQIDISGICDNCSTKNLE